jgi:hypothetical protein
MTEKQEKTRRLGMDASYLACCALHGRVPNCKDMDLEGLYRFCQFHSITAMVAMALEEAWKTTPAQEDIMQKFRQTRDKAIRKNILLNTERQRILAHLESIGCWYLPLKGSLLQFDYPKFGMRQMSDNDILFDHTRAVEVHDYLLSIGYEVGNYLQGYHDEYTKKPVYNMEMHRMLFLDYSNPVLADYYKDVKSRLILDEGSRFGYHFTHEDFYIFMVVHSFRHYYSGGVGIRTLLDTHVFLNRHGSELNWEYLEQELRLLGAWDFDVECRHLARKLFSDPDAQVVLTEQEQKALDVYLFSGAYGTEQQQVENQVKAVSDHGKSGGKLRYLWNRLVPGMARMKDRYKILNKYPWLAPVCYAARMISAIIGWERISRELKNLRKAKK